MVAVKPEHQDENDYQAFMDVTGPAGLVIDEFSPKPPAPASLKKK